MADCPILNVDMEIPREECIGNSLNRINENFDKLKTQSCDNYSRLDGIDANILNLQTLYSTVSSVALPGMAKAWVKFDGTRDRNGQITAFLTNRFIYSSYNIGSVYKKKTGDYRIFFSPPLTNRNYVVVGTNNEVITEGGDYAWLQPYAYTSTYVDVRVHGNTITDTVDPKHVSVVIF